MIQCEPTAIKSLYMIQEAPWLHYLEMRVLPRPNSLCACTVLRWGHCMFLARQKGSLCFMWIRGQIGPLYCSKRAVVSTLLIYVCTSHRGAQDLLHPSVFRCLISRAQHLFDPKLESFRISFELIGSIRPIHHYLTAFIIVHFNSSLPTYSPSSSL